MKFWRNILIVLILVWCVAGGIIFWARSARPTAASVEAFVSKHPVASLTGTERTRSIKRVAEMLNALSFDERQTLREQGVTREFFKELTPEEQIAFLDATLPSGFKQMMEAFNKMDPAKRKKFVANAMDEAKKRQGENPAPGIDDKLAQKMVSEGLRSFYSDASAEVKLDLAPLIEQMQRDLQSIH